ncbi:MAG TPA: EAL domain-containing protein [Acetobacteraceae bacterium]|nr:EAL domain-containing protein [Acetobacteraceae bacterium]
MLIALGGVSICVSGALAGLGLWAASLQLHAHERVAIIERAVQNHRIADALFDDVRADVNRGLLAAVGLNKVDSRPQLLEDLAELRTNIGKNLAAPLPENLHRTYSTLNERVRGFAAGAKHVLELAGLDPTFAAHKFEAFNTKFADADALMDGARDELSDDASRLRAKAAIVFVEVRWMIIGSLMIGAAMLVLITGVAVRLSEAITAALASSREEAQHLALHDPLTGLPNRVLLAERLRVSLAEVRRNKTALAILCLDLDRFKQVNDTLGHPVGDELLRAVGGRIRRCVRETDTIARLGGDEFAIVQTAIARAEDAGDLAQRIIDLLSEPYEIGEHQVVIGASIGLALAPADSMDPLELLKMADTALYRAKVDGRGIFRSFKADMDARLQARRLLELDLRRALRVGEFELHYQPLMDLASNRVSGFEALVRWRHPERGLIPPSDFIPLAEEIGLIEPLGHWVLVQACQDAAKWPGDVRIAVNVAAAQFKGSGLVPAVEEALAASGLAPERLELEITETALLERTEATLSILNELRSRGVRIAMDDFGTGYSSLGYLLSFPFDKIKIDACFIRNIETRADSRAIVRAVVGLGKDLGITTVAEGVETTEQLSKLMSKGCQQIQGYLLSRPVPVQDVGKFFDPPPASETTSRELLAAEAG